MGKGTLLAEGKQRSLFSVFPQFLVLWYRTLTSCVITILNRLAPDPNALYAAARYQLALYHIEAGEFKQAHALLQALLEDVQVREGEREGGAEEIRFPRGGRREDTGSNCFATSRLSCFYALSSPLFFPLLLSFHTVQPSKNAVHDIFTVHLLLAGSALLQDQLPSAGSAAEEALAFVEVLPRLT